MVCANFTAGRRKNCAVPRKQTFEQRMQEIEIKLRAGMTANGIRGEAQEKIVNPSHRLPFMDSPNPTLPVSL